MSGGLKVMHICLIPKLLCKSLILQVLLDSGEEFDLEAKWFGNTEFNLFLFFRRFIYIYIYIYILGLNLHLEDPDNLLNDGVKVNHMPDAKTAKRTPETVSHSAGKPGRTGKDA